MLVLSIIYIYSKCYEYTLLLVYYLVLNTSVSASVINTLLVVSQGTKVPDISG
nr:MAG TPA: hypothetical protein [Caudoviricetes sp.]